MNGFRFEVGQKVKIARKSGGRSGVFTEHKRIGGIDIISKRDMELVHGVHVPVYAFTYPVGTYGNKKKLYTADYFIHEVDLDITPTDEQLEAIQIAKELKEHILAMRMIADKEEQHIEV